MKGKPRILNLLVIFVFLFGALGVGQKIAMATVGTIQSGDIAVILMNSDNPDSIAFVALADLPDGESIIFTDSGWYGSGGFRVNEGAVRYTVPTGGIPAGTIIYRDNPFDSGNWDVPTGLGFNGSFALASDGDQVIVFQGDTSAYSLIFAVNDEGSAEWQADATSSNTSALPTGLINGETAVAINEADNIRLNCTENHSGTKQELLEYISNASNWVGDNSLRQSVDPNCSFTVTDNGLAEPKINEFVANHSGSDYYEYMEVYGNPETDYSEYTLLQVEGDDGNQGVIDSVIPVGATDANGFWWTSYLSNELENGTMTIILVKGFTGVQDDDIDTDDDGSLDSMPWDEIVDSIAVSDGGSSDITYGLPVLTPGFDGNSFTPGAASRIPDGYDTESTTDWIRNDYDLNQIPDFGEAYNTPGSSNVIEACGAPITPIFDIQGDGLVSPLDGDYIVTEGVVVGNFLDAGLDGFFIQDMDGDSDSNTSDGIFIYAPTSDVNVGDHIRVQGPVSEYQEQTEIGFTNKIQLCASGVPLPDAAEITFPLASIDSFESYEGMYVTLPQDLVISEYFNFDRFGEIVLTSERYLIFTAENEPDPTAYAAFNLDFDLNSITLDDGSDYQNPDPALHPNGLEFDLYNRFRGGDLLTNVTGIMDQRRSFYNLPIIYRIQPTEGADYTAANPRPTASDIIEGDIKVASLNVYNYFTTLTSQGDICGPSGDMGCRGADTPEELARQRAKIIAALAGIDADVVGLMEIENDRLDAPTPDYAVADLVSGLNAMVGAGTYDYIPTGAIGSDAIKVAMIYKPGKVTPLGPYAVLDATVDPTFRDDYNRPVLAQSFTDNLTSEVVTVAVNHLKSKGSECDAIGDPDLGDGAGNCNLTRLAAAEAEVDWLATDPTGSGVDNTIIIGDLNSYDKEDPIDAIKLGSDDTPGTDDDYFDMIYEILGEDAYSYVFDGQVGYLDYALVNKALYDNVTDVAIWHINADEPDLIDYDMTYKQDAQDAIYAPDAYRSSDHDPVIITLTFNQPPHAEDDAYETDQDTTLTVPAPGVMDNDGDVNEYDTLLVDRMSGPTHGDLTLNEDGSFVYIPDHNFFGEDSFTYTLLGLPPELLRSEYSDSATVTITVHPAETYFLPLMFN